MDRSTDPTFRFALEEKNHLRCYYRDSDAADVRSEFFLIRTPDDTLGFFRRHGPWEIRPGKETKSKQSGFKADPIKWSEIDQARTHLEGAFVNDEIPASLYELLFGRPLILELPFIGSMTDMRDSSEDEWIIYCHDVGGRKVSLPDRRDGDHGAVVHCHDVIDALRASIFLARLNSSRWKRCARQGCDQLFESHSKRERLYCTPECGHLQAVREYNTRKREKNAQAQRKK